MKVILLADVKNVGKKGEVVKVAAGYGRNYLIRNNLAVVASDESLNVLKAEKKEEAKQVEKAHEEALKNKEKIEKLSLEFLMQVGKEGKIFGSVSSKQVAKALLDDHKIKVDRRKFLDNGPYVHLGVNNIRIELYKDVVATLEIVLKENK